MEVSQRKFILLEKSNSHCSTNTHTFWSERANPGALYSCVWQLPALIVFGAFFCFPKINKKCVGKIL